MLPPVVVAIPMFLMYRIVGLNDSHLGLIILYTAFNLSFSVWLMKGFIDEIPREYEEAALVDGYTSDRGLLQNRPARGDNRIHATVPARTKVALDEVVRFGWLPGKVLVFDRVTGDNLALV